MVLEGASRGRLRYRGILDSSNAVCCSSVHFISTVRGGVAVKTRNIDSHRKPVFRFKEITKIYDIKCANSIIEIPLLGDGKTVQCSYQVEKVEGNGFVKNNGNGCARDSYHDQNCDDFGFDEMTLMELKASCKRKRKFSKSVDPIQQGKNSLQFKNLCKETLSHIQVKEEEPDLEESLSCLKMRLSKNAKIKRKHEAKHGCSSPPESSGAGNLESKGESRLAPSAIVMQNEPDIHGHSMQDRPSLHQQNQIKSENADTEIFEQNQACAFESAVEFCNRNPSPFNEPTCESLDSPCLINLVKSENIDIGTYDQKEACVFDPTAKFIRNQSPFNKPSSEPLDSLCQLNQIASDNADIEMFDQDEDCVFDSTAKFCIWDQSPYTESSSESPDKVDGKRMEIGVSISFSNEEDGFKVSSSEFCGIADEGELNQGDLTSAENSVRGTENDSSVQFVDCCDRGLEFETVEDIEVVETSTELENHEPTPSSIPKLKMEIALNHPLSSGNPEEITVSSRLNYAVCSNDESKPSRQEVLPETHNSPTAKMPEITSDDNLLCTETDDGWFCNSGKNDLGIIVNGILVERKMAKDQIDQHTADISNYSTVDSSARDALSQNLLQCLAVADSSQPLGDDSSLTKVLFSSASTEELVPHIEDLAKDCSMDSCSFDTSEVLIKQEIENPCRPENLKSTRKVISPKSQAKLCEAVVADELCDGVQLSKHGKRLCFEKWTKNMASFASEVAEEAEFTPNGPLKKLKYATNVSPPKGILKSSHVSCMISCTCKDCSSIHERAEKAIAFSQRQMHDIECLAMKLLKGLKSMRSMVEDALVSIDCPSTTSKHTTDEMRIAADETTKLEETTRKWLSMMGRDCNRFCKIMRSKDKSTPSKQPNGSHKERRKVVFADDIGAELCHVKLLEDHSAPHFLQEI